MDIIAEIRAALLLANPDDLEDCKRYLQWMAIRQRVTDRFYFRAHWLNKTKTPGLLSQASKPLLVSNPRNAHWL